MQSSGSFSQLFTLISQACSSVGYKTQSLELLDPNHITEDEFMIKIFHHQKQYLNTRIYSLQFHLINWYLYQNKGKIIKGDITSMRKLEWELEQMQNNQGGHYKNKEIGVYKYNEEDKTIEQMQNNQGGHYKNKEIGVGANAKVFVYKYNEEDFALKTMEKFNINMLEFYIQECVNQYNLIQLNKHCILNFKGQVYISISGNQASLYIPLELAEHNLYEYIQNNEITLEIYQYFYNLLIDLLILLHSNNYAHRDIKPQNILFIKGEGWKLADFGESVKYEQRQGLYKIQGTEAFLPEEIRKQIHKNKEVLQNLYQNDIYAVICTLVMIKNPQFKSQNLINYMDAQNLDQDLQNIYSTLNCDNGIEQLLQLKNHKLKMDIEAFNLNQRIFSTNYILRIDIKLLFLYNSQLCMDQDFLIIIDTCLKILQVNQRQNEHLKLQLYLTLLCPFQIHQLNNFNQQLLNHQKIIEQKQLFLDDKAFEFIYLLTFKRDDQNVEKLLLNYIEQNNISFLLQTLRIFINVGKIELAKKLLEKIGKLMLQMDFYSNLLYIYNLFYQQLHGKSISFSENYLEEDYLNNIKQEYDIDIEKKQFQFDKENYLNQNKFIDINTLDMIKLLDPLFSYILDQQTINIVCRHIIENLGFSELSIAKDKFKLSNFIKQQLIKTGFFRYQFFIYEIIVGIVKLFLQYDLFEGLLDLLHYFLNFMKFLDRLIYHYIISVIQNLIYKLNIPLYHIKDDLYIQFVYNTSDHRRFIHVFLLDNINKFQYNMIQDQQKTQQKQIQLDFQLMQKSLNEFKVNKAWVTRNCRELFLTIYSFAQFLGQIEHQNQKYLSILVIVSKSLYEINSEYIKSQVCLILLEYFINCQQYNRITELFNDTREDIILSKQQVNHFAEKLLIKYNNLNRINSNSAFIYPDKLATFVQNQKFRQLFDFKQHLYVASKFKRSQKRLNFRDMCLKEQYLRI